MTMEYKCYCRGDEETSLDLDKPQHLMPMMRPFSMRITNLETILSNMLHCGLLTDILYHGNGHLLVNLWKKTAHIDYNVHLHDPRFIPWNVDWEIR